MRTILLLAIFCVLLLLAVKVPGESITTTSQRIVSSFIDLPRATPTAQEPSERSVAERAFVPAPTLRPLVEATKPEPDPLLPSLSDTEKDTWVLETPKPDITAELQKPEPASLPPVTSTAELPEYLPIEEEVVEDPLPAIQALYREASRLLNDE